LGNFFFSVIFFFYLIFKVVSSLTTGLLRHRINSQITTTIFTGVTFFNVSHILVFPNNTLTMDTQRNVSCLFLSVHQIMKETLCDGNTVAISNGIPARNVNKNTCVCTCVFACIEMSSWVDPGRDHGDGVKFIVEKSFRFLIRLGTKVTHIRCCSIGLTGNSVTGVTGVTAPRFFVL
jgi:hypothetical protein